MNEQSSPTPTPAEAPAAGAVALRVKDGEPLDRRRANVGFSERGETVFIASAPKDRGLRLFVDDEPLAAEETADGAVCWRWKPGFFAGEVRARLSDAEQTTLATYRLDVGPEPGKLGGVVFKRMIDEILEFDSVLVLGAEPARHQMGAVDPTDNPLVLFERLRKREEALNAALAAIRCEPVTVLRQVRRFTPLRRVHRADIRTLLAALRNHAALESLPGIRSSATGMTANLSGSPAAGAAEPTFDTPEVERTLDSPANRAALLMLQALIRRAAELPTELEALAEAKEADTLTPLSARLPEWGRILKRLERGFRTTERRPPFSQVTRAEVTAAGLNAVSAHPAYSRFWQTAWAALRPGVYGLDRDDLLPLAPTWEIYERWCFVALAKQLGEWLPEWGWTLGGERGTDRRRAVGSKDGVTLTLHLQFTFHNTRGAPEEDGWSISRERRPDLVLTRREGDVTSFVLLDSKYTAKNLLKEIGDTAHAYQDGLRWGQDLRPAATLILAPTIEGVKSGVRPWLADESYIREHRVGAIAMRPDCGPPDWLRKFLLDPPPPLAHASSGSAPS